MSKWNTLKPHITRTAGDQINSSRNTRYTEVGHDRSPTVNVRSQTLTNNECQSHVNYHDFQHFELIRKWFLIVSS